MFVFHLQCTISRNAQPATRREGAVIGCGENCGRKYLLASAANSFRHHVEAIIVREVPVDRPAYFFILVFRRNRVFFPFLTFLYREIELLLALLHDPDLLNEVGVLGDPVVHLSHHLVGPDFSVDWNGEFVFGNAGQWS